ncbi:ATP-binding cassette domain-containing protein [Sulfurospirillum diekertiae]|uniref:Nitrous oxide reductase accessory membrane protein NosY n=1 Tax=Sulfurospirillum diekertiae TaxID=1854492 RepID=A0A1Y0HJK5_9BACT|nr:ABC transporter ATP-binding protein [Sulfurospirillum diekertiae]ARU48140.1 nitrous oxide reductase accessory membrane protein NosY [Sulfurospirillum diekertiae]ASC92983.1 nitrous oxide reductase accessory membrane protein NosY [Sulfurospirillum diekertiae]
MIEIRNVSKKFGNVLSLDDLTLTLHNDDCVALMGPNGAGKTTLIRLILGYYHPNNGTVLINGLDPIKERIHVLQNISFVPQLPPPIKLNLDELMSYACKSTHVEKEAIIHFAKEMELDIEPNLNKSFFKLSGGMKQKMLIAISLARQSDIIIYDEPTANLDPKARDNFYRLLKNEKRSKISLFVTHRLDEMKELVNRQIYMDLGKVLTDEKV